MTSKNEFPAGTLVGLIGMSGKPIHAGHIRLVEMAAAENDYVIIFISLADRRDSKSNVTIYGDDMDMIWTRYLMPILPSNVIVMYSRIPIADIFKHLEGENERFVAGEDVASYNIYATPEDVQGRFSEVKLSKYLDEMWHAGLIIVNPIERTSTVDISGTKMRMMLKQGDEAKFKSYLPKKLSTRAKDDIWNILSNSMSL